MNPPPTDLPYYEIPQHPDEYNAGTVAARVVDGLGYRYYWATEGLREEDLNYRASEDSRKVAETLDHILGLSNTISNAAKKLPNISPADREELTWEEKRARTLENIKRASDILRNSTGTDLEEFDVIFKRGENSSVFPFWNMLNGPIADAIYHVGQVVALRRASGNPLHPNVSVFIGKNRE